MAVMTVTVVAAATMAMQLVADLADDVERPLMTVAMAADQRVNEEVGADADSDRAAVGLGLGGVTGGDNGRERQRGEAAHSLLHGILPSMPVNLHAVTMSYAAYEAPVKFLRLVY
jgi:hypothetical protein